MLNFIQVSFCFVLFLGLGLGLGLGIDNLKKYLKIFDRWRCKHVGHSLALDACYKTTHKWAWPGSRDAISKFWNPYTFERKELSA